jgi:hypothetical protein
MSSSFEDEVEPSLFEELEEYICQGLKWKQEGGKKKKLPYIVHMGMLLYI